MKILVRYFCYETPDRQRVKAIEPYVTLSYLPQYGYGDVVELHEGQHIGRYCIAHLPNLRMGLIEGLPADALVIDVYLAREIEFSTFKVPELRLEPIE